MFSLVFWSKYRYTLLIRVIVGWVKRVNNASMANSCCVHESSWSSGSVAKSIFITRSWTLAWCETFWGLTSTRWMTIRYHHGASLYIRSTPILTSCIIRRLISVLCCKMWEFYTLLDSKSTIGLDRKIGWGWVSISSHPVRRGCHGDVRWSKLLKRQRFRIGDIGGVLKPS